MDAAISEAAVLWEMRVDTGTCAVRWRFPRTSEGLHKLLAEPPFVLRSADFAVQECAEGLDDRRRALCRRRSGLL